MLMITGTALPTVELAGYGVCHPGWTLARRTLTDYEFLLVMEGEMEFEVEQARLRLGGREYIVLLPGQPHAINWVAPGTSYGYLHFSLGPWRGERGEGEICLALHGRLEHGYGRAERLLEEAIAAAENPDRYSKLLLQGLLLQLLALLGENTARQAGGGEAEAAGSYPSMVRDAIFYIENQYPQAQSVQQLAQVFQVTPQHFIHTFRTCVGCTPLQYINHWKIQRAKTMIRLGTMSFEEITYALHWETPHYFSKMFKKATGMTPGDYKKYITQVKNRENEA